VKVVIGQDPSGNGLFVFRSRRGDRLNILTWDRDGLNILTWDRDGFVLWYKRLEAGVFKLPRIAAGARSIELRASELAMIMDGIDMSKLKRVPRYERADGTNKSNVQRVSA
jgi:transposase